MAFADSWAAVRGPHDPLSPESGTRPRPPEVSTAAFTAHLPNLQPWPLMDMDFVIILPARPTKPASYPVSVRQVAALLHASFRPRLTTTPLRFANPSPPSGWVEDFHLRAAVHARHTKKAGPKRDRLCGALRVRQAHPARFYFMYLTSRGTISRATMLTTLIIGLMAGPAVSL